MTLTTPRLTALLTTAVFGFTATAQASVIIIRDGAGGIAAGVTHATFDDTSLNRISPDSNYGGSTAVELRFPTQGPGNANTRVALLAVKDLFTLLPATNLDGEFLQITNATLTLTRSVGNASQALSINRMVFDWLPYDAGANESVVTWNHQDTSTDPETPWPATSFTERWQEAFANYQTDEDNTFFTLENQAISTWRSDNGPVNFDITMLLKDIYESGENYGFAIMEHNEQGANAAFRSSEYGTNAAQRAERPTLTIEYAYIPEPGSLALLGLGACMLLGGRRR